MKIRPGVLLLCTVSSLLLGTGCARVRSKAAYQDGNKAYREENFRRAVERYSAAVEFDPNMIEAYFYLGSSQQAMYRPGKEGQDNKQRLADAIAAYKKVLELSSSNPTIDKTVKANALGALTGIYSEDPYKNYEESRGYAERLVKDDPNDVRNLYAMANLYEKFGKVAEAEAAYRKAAELNQKDTKACGALAGFYNKPNWDDKGEVWQEGTDRPRRAKFEEAVSTLERCATLDPNEPGGYQKVAAFYWDKAYRDPLLDDKKKEEYAEKGLQNVDKALSIKPDYFEAVIYKGLLYRVKAVLAKNPAQRMQFMNEAADLQKQGLELKKQQELAQAAAKAS
jgi:tetratricopeptide (TPR) repeat protein